MTFEVKMPQYNMGMAVGTITSWFKTEGDSVIEGEPIAEIESEKATNELIAPYSGVLRKILVEEGESVDVGALLAIIE
ncbi:MAG: hypothetical protein FWH52_01710 [Synergistaceae bacterium]|nr:hypothetical protein [Synergistaceae bacterium]